MSSQDNSPSLAITDEELARLKAELDLPDRVIEFLRHQPLPAHSMILTGIVILSAGWTILTVLPLVGIFVLDFEKFLADAGFLAQDTIMFDLGFEDLLGAICLAAAGAFPLSFYVLHVYIRQNRSLYDKFLAFLLSSPRRGHRTGRQNHSDPMLPFIRWLLRGINRSLLPQDYLKRFERRMAACWAGTALVVYLAAFAVFMLDLNGMTRVTPDGIAMSSNLSGRNLTYQWRDVVSIRTGCLTVRDRKNVSHRVTYHLQFNDGRIVNLGSYTPLGATWLGALETVDGKLAALGVSRIKGNFDQGCLDAKRRRLDPQDYERLAKILE